MINLLLAVLVLGSFTGGVNGQQVDVYKVVSVYNNSHTIQVQDTKGNVFEYYQEKPSKLCINDQVIDVDGLLLQCKDANSYDIIASSLKVFEENKKALN